VVRLVVVAVINATAILAGLQFLIDLLLGCCRVTISDHMSEVSAMLAVDPYGTIWTGRLVRTIIGASHGSTFWSHFLFEQIKATFCRNALARFTDKPSYYIKVMTRLSQDNRSRRIRVTPDSAYI
jgi:hypothetical protein